MPRLAIALSMAATLAAPGVALASTVSVDPSTGTAVFRSGPHASDVTSDIRAFPHPPFTPALPFTDAAQPLIAGPGCVAGTPVWCQAQGEDVRLSPRSDRYVGFTPSPTSVVGGAGADDIQAFSFDELTVRGDSGADRIAASGNSNDVSGGPGRDTISLVSNSTSHAYGGPGDDDIFGQLGGNTVIATGGPGSDLVAGNRPSSTLSGGPGDDDLLLLGIAEGALRGGNGDDVLLVRTTLPGSHTIDGGSGNDTIDVSGDGASDTVDCGSGRDIVYADPEDVIAADCERRLPGPPANARVDAALARFNDVFGDAG